MCHVSHFANAQGVVIHVLYIAVDVALPQRHLTCQPRPEFGAKVRAANYTCAWVRVCERM